MTFMDKMRDFSLANQIAVVTHATQANGPAICEALGRQGAKVVVGDMLANNPVAEAQHLAKLGYEALAIEVDASQVDQLQNLMTQVVQRYGHIDIMVNNTLLNKPQPVEDLPIETFTQGVSATIDSVFFGCQVAAQHMLEQEALQTEPYPLKGSIINVASVAGEMAIPGHAAYCSAMAGVIAITKVLAAEWGPQGVRVAAVGAGITESLLKSIGIEDLSNVESTFPAETYMTLKSNAPTGYIPVKATASPPVVGQAVAYLASGAASYITGTTLYTDGGWLAYGYL